MARIFPLMHQGRSAPGCKHSRRESMAFAPSQFHHILEYIPTRPA